MEIKVSKTWRKRLGLADGEVFEVKSNVEAFDDKATTDFSKPLPRQHQAILSTASVDLEDEVLLSKGCGFSVFEKNPLAFFGHAWRHFPIGNWKDWGASSSKVTGTVDIVERPIDRPKEQVWDPDDVNYLIHRRVLRGVSVGFKRLEASRPEPKEIEKEPEWSKARTIVRRWLLLEASIVPMPCNHEAWLREVSEGTVSKAMKEALDAPEALSLDDALWKLAHSYLKGEVSNEEIDGHEDADQVKYILSILALHGIDRNLLAQAALAKDLLASEEDFADGDKPYPNEHACRLVDPAQCKEPYGSKPAKHAGKPVRLIFGTRRDTGKMVLQAIRYPKSSWSAEEARAACKGHNGSLFEAAKEADPPAIQKIEHVIQGYTIAQMTEVVCLATANVLDKVFDLVDNTLAQANGRVIRK